MTGLALAPALLRRNATWLGLARLATTLQTAAFTLMVARALGAEGFGQYSLITSVVAIANVFTTFGTDTLLIRETARTPRSRHNLETAALLLQILFSAAFILGVFLWAMPARSGWGSSRYGPALYSLALLPLAFFSVYTAVLRGLERMGLYLLLNLAVLTFQTAGAWILLGRGGGLGNLLVWLLVTQVFAALAAGWLSRAAGFAGFARAGIGWRALRRVALSAWPLGLIGLLGILYQRLGVLVLAGAASADQVGWYAAAVRIVELLKLGHIAVLGALLPALVRTQAGAAAAEAQRALRGALGLLLAVALAAAVAVAILARPLIPLLFGASFAPAVPLAQVLVLSLLPYTVSACLSIWAVATGREAVVLRVTLQTLLVTAAAAILLARANGTMGVAWAIVFGECLQAILFWLMTRGKSR